MGAKTPDRGQVGGQVGGRDENNNKKFAIIDSPGGRAPLKGTYRELRLDC